MLRMKDHTRYKGEIISVQDLTPHMRRLTLVGEGLNAWGKIKPAQWLKVGIPGPSNPRAVSRAYTIRHFHQAAGRVEIDFVLHGDNGPASQWVSRVRRGEVIELSAPRGGHDIRPDIENYVLVGDATALPAISSILEALPPSIRAKAFIEVSSAAEEQPLSSLAELDVTWIHSENESPGTTGQLELALHRAALSAKNGQAWVAGEAFMVRSVSTHLTVDRGFPSPHVDAKGYWKLGEAGHRG
jgi:NADPH-dependent ferric siderophore reductase